MPADFDRVLVLMAHPDDPEYGVAAAVAEWTRHGKDVSYVLATRGEAGIAGMDPADAGPRRVREQRRACEHVGVSSLEFLDYPDGRLEESLDLRRDLARAIRRYRPELVVSLNHRDSWAPGRWNSQDHQVMGRSVLNAVADAANEWIFPELIGERLSPHAGVRWVAMASPQPTHELSVEEVSVVSAVESLTAHDAYLRALSDTPVAEQAEAQVRMVTDGGGGHTRVRFELFHT